MKINTLIFVLATLCGLVGCASTTPLGKFTLADATAAQSLAKANNDTPAVTCYTAVITAINAISAVPFQAGALYANEVLRISTVQQGLVNAACVGLL